MVGIVFTTHRFTPGHCRANPNIVFVFGDNTRRVGKAGQAAIRDEDNAFGVCTKWAPTRSPKAYFTDIQLSYTAIRNDWLKLLDLHEQNIRICLPEDGLGTGLSKLSTKAPQLAYILDHWIRDLFLGRTPHIPEQALFI